MPNLIDRRDGEAPKPEQNQEVEVQDTQNEEPTIKNAKTGLGEEKVDGKPVNDVTLSVVGNNDGKLEGYWKAMIEKGFIGEGTDQVAANGSEVIDIVTEYEWSLNRPTQTGVKDQIRAVPCVYAIEKFQKFGATAMNFYNSIWAIKNAGQAIIGDAGGIFGKITSALGDALSSFGSQKDGNNVIGKIGKTLTDAGTATTNWANGLDNGYGGLLDPYKHLYALGDTNKHYCFPYFGEGSAAWSLNNDFSSEGSKGLLSKAMMGTLDTLSKGLIDFAGDIQEISNLIAGNNKDVGGFVMYNLEKAKAFSFPTSGKSISVRFPLFNTTKLDAWKDNYKFIVLFGFRNMLFRKDNVQYYPPLIYDVTIPGWGRMPFSYVKQFTVKPIGQIRPLAMDNFVSTKEIGSNVSKITVNVPEAWVIQIDFMSLIADSGNQFLSSLIDLPITVAL